MAQICVDRTESARQKLGLCFAIAEAACPIALMTNDLAAAEKLVAMLSAAAKDINLTYWQNLARCLEGVLLIKQGEYAKGVATLRAALKVCDGEGGATLLRLSGRHGQRPGGAPRCRRGAHRS